MSVLLLVEGPDDFHTIGNLIDRGRAGTYRRFDQRVGAQTEFVIKPMGGYVRLRQSLASELISSELTHCGIVVDADANLATRWNSITDRLRELQSPLAFALEEVPNAPDTSGTVLQTNTTLTIGIWLWPNNLVAGDMESFAGMLVPPQDRLWAHADQAIQSLPETRFTETHRSKAHIHTWLAWQDPPGQQLGEAIRSSTLQSDSVLAQNFLNWLVRLKETNP